MQDIKEGFKVSSGKLEVGTEPSNVPQELLEVMISVQVGCANLKFLGADRGREKLKT